MLNVFDRVKVFKIVGEIMANPEKFKQEFQFDVTASDGQSVEGKFRITGELAKLISGRFDGQISMEKAERA